MTLVKIQNFLSILTFGHWASKVSDTSGYDTFTITTIQGKGSKFVSFISAYIAVQKGSDIGVESLYAQQYTLYERSCLKTGNPPNYKFCPRKDPIRRLNLAVKELQDKQHAVILMLDANQSGLECMKGTEVQPYTIEWL